MLVKRIVISLLLLTVFYEGTAQVKRIAMDEHVRRTSIYPNPARSFVRIQYKYASPQPSALAVFNFLGQKQMEMFQPGTNVYIDLAEFKRGIYIFQFRDKNGQIVDSGKFQVEK